uniref:Uncharacterized protein n=1 Tax=Romanomermis culicivorax TaxID=13658 RepID=A0A915IQE9_ROMCU
MKKSKAIERTSSLTTLDLERTASTKRSSFDGLTTPHCIAGEVFERSVPNFDPTFLKIAALFDAARSKTCKTPSFGRQPVQHRVISTLAASAPAISVPAILAPAVSAPNYFSSRYTVM